jgi:hypothetical protein
MFFGRKRIPLLQAGAELAQCCSAGAASFRDQIAEVSDLVAHEFLIVHIAGYRTGISHFCYSKRQMDALLNSFDSNLQQITGNNSALYNSHGQHYMKAFTESGDTQGNLAQAISLIFDQLSRGNDHFDTEGISLGDPYALLANGVLASKILLHAVAETKKYIRGRELL